MRGILYVRTNLPNSVEVAYELRSRIRIGASGVGDELRYASEKQFVAEVPVQHCDV